MQSIEDSLKKKHKKIKNSNMENINWKLTIVINCLTLNNA